MKTILEINSEIQSLTGCRVSYLPQKQYAKREYGIVDAVYQNDDWNWEIIVRTTEGKKEKQRMFRFPISVIDQTLYFQGRQEKVRRILFQLLELNPSGKGDYLSAKKVKNIQDFRMKMTRSMDLQIFRSSQEESSKIKITSGNKDKKRSNENKNVYTCFLARNMKFPDNTSVIISQGDATYEGIILESEEDCIILGCVHDFGEKIENLEIETDLQWLQVREERKFYETCAHPTSITRDLILNGPKEVCDLGKAITTGQDAAVQAADSQKITCIWGPPGTGKTHTLCRILREKMKRKEKILMTSFSNVSVDTALLKLVDIDSQDDSENSLLEPGVALRIGETRSSKIENHPFLTPNALLDFKNSKPVREYKRILKDIKNLDRVIKSSLDLYKKNLFIQGIERYHFHSPHEYSVSEFSSDEPLKRRAEALKESLERKLKELEAPIKEERNKLIENAPVIFSTASKMIASNVHHEFDTVILDEVSMVTLPQFMILANMAHKNFICLGDFNQLPPVVNGILQTDVFRYLGIYDALMHNRAHKWLVMLDTQYRMHSQISEFLGKRMYFNQLKTGSRVNENLLPIVNHSPFSGKSMVLADCSGLMTTCRTLSSGSRVNILSSLLSLRLALKYAEQFSVAIISPYRAQAELINAFLRSLNPVIQKNGGKPIRAATVHQFQGSESDVVILDLTDCYRAPYVSTLLSKKENDIANRLMNVSMSRARGKLIVLGYRDFFLNKELSSELILEQFFYRMEKEKENRYRGNQLMEELINQAAAPEVLDYSDETQQIPVFEMFEKIEKVEGEGEEENKLNPWIQFTNDIHQAKESIQIDLPGNPGPSDYTDSLLSDIYVMMHSNRTPVKITIRTEYEDRVAPKYHSLVEISYNSMDPVVIIDEKIIWYGMPDGRNSYHTKDGTILSTSAYPVFRIESSDGARNLLSILNQRRSEHGDFRISGFSESLNELIQKKYTCSHCQSPLELKNSRRGPYVKCTGDNGCQSQKDSRLDEIIEELVNEKQIQPLCPMCGGQLTYHKGAPNKPYFFQCDQFDNHNFTLDKLL